MDDLDPALKKAILINDFEGVKTAIRNGANPNQGQYGSLDFIADEFYEDGRLEMLRLLLKFGADPNFKVYGVSPLETAARSIGITNEYRENLGEEDFTKYLKRDNEAIAILCPLTHPDIIQEVNKKYPGVLPESCLSSSTTARLEPAMKSLEAHTNKSYGSPPGTYDVPPGFSESVGEYAFGIKTPRPTAGKRKQKRKTNKRRKTTKRRKTLKK